MLDLCMRNVFTARDTEPIRVGQIVHHVGEPTSRGRGRVAELGCPLQGRVLVDFDSGVRDMVYARDLYHA